MKNEEVHIDQFLEGLEELWPEPMEEAELVLAIQGITSAGYEIVPGLVGETVEVVTTQGQRIIGTCLGFLEINTGAGVKNPYVTVEDARNEHETIRYNLPPGVIAVIENL